MAQRITMDTRLGSLPPGVINQVERRLQLNKNWERAAAAVTRRNGSLMFDYMSIEILSQHATSAAKQLMRSLVTEGYTVGWFLDIMMQTQLYLVADYLTVDVMGATPLQRGQSIQSIQGAGLPPPGPPRSPIPSNRTPMENTARETFRHPAMPKESFPAGRPSDGAYSYGTESLAEKSYNMDIVETNLTSLHLQGGNKLQGETSDSQTMSYPNPDVYTGLPPIKNKKGEPHRFPYSLLQQITGSFSNTSKSQGGHHIGDGGFGDVFYARYNEHQLAIKRLHENSPVTPQEINTEVENMSRVDHVNILPLMGYSNDGPRSCIVYQYMRNGSLEECLACKNNQRPLSIHKRIDIALGLAEGIRHLHTLNIIHRDIKSANVLLDENFVAKLGDFGIARHCPSLLDENKTSTRIQVIQGTRAYIAPETWQSGKISPKIDVYSYGVVLLELLTGLKPYDEKREEPCLSKHIEEECGADLLKFMEMMVDKEVVFQQSVVKGVFFLSLRCLADKPVNRPELTIVVKELQML